MAYHGTTLGALSATGIPQFREPFEPLLPWFVQGAEHLRLGEGRRRRPAGRRAALRQGDRSRRSSTRAPRPSRCSSPSRCRTSAASWCRPTATGRSCAASATSTASCSRPTRSSAPSAASATGSGRERQGVVPDLVTFAKGVTSAYAPLAGIIVREPLIDELLDSHDRRVHARRHVGRPPDVDRGRRTPTSRRCATSTCSSTCSSWHPYFRGGLDDIAARHRIVKEVRGAGYFYGLELMVDRDGGREFTAEREGRRLPSGAAVADAARPAS